MADVASLSDEQQRVLHAVKHRHNVVCDSVAGSGKTTTVLGIASVLPESKILLLTYNQRLKFETRARVRKLGIENMQVHSFHSFAVKHYMRDCFTDFQLAILVETNVEVLQPFYFNMVIIDEAQDMTPLYYSLVMKMIRDMKHTKRPQICVLGDRYQSIFKYNHSDERFIVFADSVFDINHRSWRAITMSTSYRMTIPMANFVNRCVLDQDRMRAVKPGPKVNYVICNCFPDDKNGGRPYQECERYLEMYSHEDIFVLAPSVKSHKTPVRLLANLISSRKKIPIFVPNSDEDKLDDTILKGKMVFSTFHQVKGLERKVTIVFGFDDSYMTYFHKEKTDTCPNTIYVAITRASECLTVFHHHENGFLPFLKTERLKDYAAVENHHGIKPKPIQASDKLRAVSDLTKHLSYHVINKCMQFIDVSVLEEEQEYINIPTKTLQGSLYETTSEITGTAIPGYFCYKSKGSLPFGKVGKELQGPLEGPSELLCLANRYCAEKSQYIYKLLQIKEYDWLAPEDLQSCIDRMHKHIPNPERAEFEVEHVYDLGKVHGFVDCIEEDRKIAWEFKCTSNIEKEHIIQMASYAYLMMVKGRKGFEYRVLNILTGEVVQVKTTKERAGEMLDYLVFCKTNQGWTQTDEEFVEGMKKYRDASRGDDLHCDEEPVQHVPSVVVQAVVA